jgi:PKHD-type hydroxylase|tara:strand:- start:8013 stop:8579 length:567 start_codon:yes stop_codon:yes gene_type:complete
MKYGAQYRIIELNDSAMSIVRETLNSENLDWKDSLTYNSEEAKKHSSRISQQAWIQDRRFCQMFIEIAKAMNVDNGWNLDIHGVEPIQFGMYPEGGKYDWHVDQHPHPVQGTVRKISMSLFLNDPSEYEGGEFDLEIYKPESDCRYETFRLSKGSAIFFPSDMWHRVRPVTSGVRKSIVAWFYGPPYT